ANHAEKYRIWSSNLYLEQFEKTYGAKESGFLTIRDHEQEKYLSIFVENIDRYKTVNPFESVQFKTLEFLWRIFFNRIGKLQTLVLKLIESLINEKGKIHTWGLSIILTDILVYEL